jgi:hypothetical protein
VSESRSKYNARRAECGDHWHASLKERERCFVLRQRAQLGEIRRLALQPRFVLAVNGQRVGVMTLDFAYDERQGSAWVRIVEDVKGGRATKTEAYSLRKRLLRACWGIEIKET